MPGMLELNPIKLFEMNGMNFMHDPVNFFRRHPLLNPPPADRVFYNDAGVEVPGRENPLKTARNQMRGLLCPYTDDSPFYEKYSENYLPLDNSDELSDPSELSDGELSDESEEEESDEASEEESQESDEASEEESQESDEASEEERE